MALALAPACGHPRHQGVGPWDFDDRPHAVEGGHEVKDPSRVIQAKGFVGDLPGGIQVRFVAISRVFQGPEYVEYSVTDRSWAADGTPYYGRELRGNGPDGRSSERENKGARYLTFEISSSKNEGVEVYGYVPDGATTPAPQPELHGRDIPTQLLLFRERPIAYRTPVVVEEGLKHRYRFALARGEWKQVFATTRMPTEPKTQEIASGPWGSLQMIGPPRRRSESGKAPSVFFRIDQTEPLEQSLHIRLFDLTGKELTAGTALPPHQTAIYARRFGQLGRIEIDARPFTYVEFQNVHFDPDPKLWGESYWGDEGEKTVSKVDGVARLEGLLRPTVEGPGWTSFQLFAPDGKLWRDYPRRNLVRPTFSAGSWPKGEVLVGLVRLDPSMVAEGRNARVEIYAAESPEPGEGLGERLQGHYQFEREDNQATFGRPSTPYVQFDVRVSGENWTAAGKAPPPREPLVGFTTEQVEAMRRGVNVGVEPFTAIVREQGSLDFYYHPKGQEGMPSTLRQGVVTWPPGSHEVRLMARLKSGQRVLLQNNSASGDGSRDYAFALNRESAPVLGGVALEEIEAFEVETRAYGKPKYLVAKLPPPAPRR